MARFLITMHMPPANPNYLVHQVIADHPAENIEEFCDILNDNAFIIVREFYFVTDKRGQGDKGWQDRGEKIINTDHIGKVAQFYDLHGNGNVISQ